MQALVLEQKGKLALREIDLPLELGPEDVKIAIHTVGVCGSDVHYYTHGAIGPYVVREPMVLGHEAAGTVVAVGSNVETLEVGDRVCMEPGIPDLASRAAKLDLPPEGSALALRVLVLRALVVSGDKRARDYLRALAARANKHPDIQLAIKDM